jgi:hypothetical protein
MSAPETAGNGCQRKPVEIPSITENLSESGFFCNCIVPHSAIDQARADVEVFLSGSKERCAGIAKAMRQESPSPLATIWFSVPRETSLVDPRTGVAQGKPKYEKGQ